jgi:lipopolysaccharide biosynthesis glycosyltransferase
LGELVRAEVPEGRLLAAADPKVFWINDDSPVAAKERAYMAGLGLSPADFTCYFNSGILRVGRASWREIGRTAWEFLRDSPDLCICHDQSALNFASRGRRLPMSMKWNFPAYWNFYGLAPQVGPRITHFMSRPKPWNGAFPPWGRAQQKPYLDFVAAHPDLASELDEFGLKLTVRYNLQQRAKWMDELAHVSRRRSVSSQVLDYEKTALV